MTVAHVQSGSMRWVAPENDKTLLVAPAANQATSLIAENREAMQSWSSSDGYDFQGRTLADLLDTCRREIFEKAIEYTQSYRDVSLRSTLSGSPAPIILGGHQPDFCHPGVWAKNFALNRWAAETGGVGIHLLIDTDVPKSLGLQVPAGSIDQPQGTYVRLDQRIERIPYEIREVKDVAAFQSFGDRVTKVLSPLIDDPLIRRYWPKVLDRAKVNPQIGLCLAQARHQIEAEWGSQTLELPQSHVCQSESFRWFTAQLLAHLPRFYEIYNGVLSEYRKQHRLRNKAHPIPDLLAEGNWLEAPFWIWSDRDARRMPLRCEHQGDKLVLTGAKGVSLSLQATPECDLHVAVDQLREAEEAGIYIRTRALLTTMFARLFCGDLFVHGIGGGHYDRLTDEMIRRFFGFQPPRYMVVSGTLRLPLQRNGAQIEDVRRCDTVLRDLVYNPDRYLREDSNAVKSSECDKWIAEKKQWIETPLTPENGSARHRGIERCNQALQAFVNQRAHGLRAKRRALMEKIRADKVLVARDYAFCLFPENLLHEFLIDSVAESL